MLVLGIYNVFSLTKTSLTTTTTTTGNNGMGKGDGKLKTLGRFYEMVTFLIKNIFFFQKQPTFFNEVSERMSSASRTDGLTTD